MRQIVLDTETTGLEVSKGHRLVEIGAVELVGRRPSGRTYHTYLNPERNIDEGAREVTGISDEFLLDKPFFKDVTAEFLAFIKDSELIIHNAPFDIGFLNAELRAADPQLGVIEDYAQVLDTLPMARDLYPGQRNSLDALCKRLGVDNTRRDLHGGLLDAQLLADVYIAMTSGQDALDFGGPAAGESLRQKAYLSDYHPVNRPRVLRPSEAELKAHFARLEVLDKAVNGKCFWRRLETDELNGA